MIPPIHLRAPLLTAVLTPQPVVLEGLAQKPMFCGLRGASQGRYRRVLDRAFRAGLGLQLYDRLPFPRNPRDPRAVSDPRLILDEFPDLVGDRQMVRARNNRHGGPF